MISARLGVKDSFYRLWLCADVSGVQAPGDTDIRGALDDRSSIRKDRHFIGRHEEAQREFVGTYFAERRQLAPGMLFVFNISEPLSFWMRNTIIPLDIIYADSVKQIVKIISNAKPFSEDQLLSEKPAMYVVEMNAGFARKHGLREGDFIDFSYTR